MIDFTDLPIRNKTYAGANGSKISVIYNGEQYMLKFPVPPLRNKAKIYTNGCASEYIGCHIFRSLGIPAQETLLGTYTKNGKEMIAVACKDFTSSGVVLQDFASLKNTIIDSEQNGYSTELEDILWTIEEQSAINPHELKNWFWDMFIVDAFIGNWNRHNGNWGFLYDVDADTVSIAPVYDCGSCLYPRANEEIMERTLEDSRERNLRIFSIPLSGIKQHNQKINYFNFLSSLKYKDCNKALKRIVPRIDMKKINALIDEIPCINDLQKTFYKTMLHARKENILDYSLKLLLDREQEAKP